jgi:AcrR family transcriptional regulator
MAATKTDKISSPFSKTNQHDQKYKTILSAASELFNIHGTRATTLTQIADKLQLTKTSLYYYVKTKEELVYQCYLSSCIEMQEMLDNAITQDGLAITKLEYLFREHFDSWNDIIDGNRGHLAALTEIGTLSTKHISSISEYYKNFVSQVVNLIKEGQVDGSLQKVDPAKTSIAIWGTLFWLPVWISEVEPTDREHAFTQWMSIIKSGLHHTKKSFSFKNFTFDEVNMAPAGFDKKEQNRKKQEAFFHAGTTFFNKKGFKGTSLDELAQSLGVTKGAFYYHIKNKDDLLSKCFDRTLRIEETVLEQSIKLETSGLEKLAFSAQRLFDIQLGSQGPLIRYATMWSLSPEKRHLLEISTRKIRDKFGEIIQQGIEDQSIKDTNLLVAENIIAGAIDAIPNMEIAIDGTITNDDAADFYHIFFNGIACN